MFKTNLSSPHGRDLRKGRVSIPGYAYLLTSVTHNRRRIFSDLRVGRLLVNEFKWVDQQGCVDSLAWVVMPNHFHWLVVLKRGSLEVLMRQVKSRSSRKINHHLQQQGQVWQRGYHDHALRKEEDLKDVARYVIANPLRAGIVERIGEYPLWDAVWL